MEALEDLHTTKVRDRAFGKNKKGGWGTGYGNGGWSRDFVGTGPLGRKRSRLLRQS